MLTSGARTAVDAGVVGMRRPYQVCWLEMTERVYFQSRKNVLRSDSRGDTLSPKEKCRVKPRHVLRTCLVAALPVLFLFLTLAHSSGAHVSAAGESGWSPDFNMRGTRSSVLALAHDGQYLYVGGDLKLAGGVPINRIVRWDGARWRPVWDGAGMDNPVHALLADGAGLYAGGAFHTSGGADSHGVARRDGQAWSALGPGFDNDGSANALALDAAGHLYAGGNFATISGVEVNSIAMWDGVQWSDLDYGPDGWHGVRAGR